MIRHLGISLLVASAAIVAPALALAPLHSYAPDDQIFPDSYIVVFDGPDSLAAARLDAAAFSESAPSPLAVEAEVHIGRIHALAVHADTDSLVSHMQEWAGVRYIERNAAMRAFGEQRMPPWNLDRVDQMRPPLNGRYWWNDNGQGKNVDVYVLDSGIFTRHEDYQGRAVRGGCFGKDCDKEGCDPHGSHVAGTVGAKTYGVAKLATMIDVQVLDCQGGGSYATVLEGFNYIFDSHRNSGKKLSVANMSLGGPRAKVINEAVDELTLAGIVVVAAAGNEGTVAAIVSPASADTAFTVGATTKEDKWATFSNWGVHVDILAPGHEIDSTANRRTGSMIMSGTSMAAPAVAGAAALVISENPAYNFVEQVQKHLIQKSSKMAIFDVPVTTPNQLLFTEPKNNGRPFRAEV